MREKQKGPPVREHRRANQGDGLTTHHQKFNTELEDLQMKKRITGSVLSAGAIVLGLAAVGCGGAIENAANGWAMLGYTLLAIVLGCAALALAGLGLVVEQRKEPQKIHKVPENTVKKAVCGRNGNDGGLSIEDGESEADVTRVIMQSAVSFVVSSVPSDLNNTQKEEIVRNFAKAAELEMRLALSRNPVTGRFEDKEAAFMEELIKRAMEAKQK